MSEARFPDHLSTKCNNYKFPNSTTLNGTPPTQCHVMISNRLYLRITTSDLLGINGNRGRSVSTIDRGSGSFSHRHTSRSRRNNGYSNHISEVRARCRSRLRNRHRRRRRPLSLRLRLRQYWGRLGPKMDQFPLRV